MSIWSNIGNISSRKYNCGHCNSLVASKEGFFNKQGLQYGAIYLCPNCDEPTYFNKKGVQIPGVPVGSVVDNVPTDIAALYNEARNSIAAGCYTASVLTCRKLLMNISVSQGAEENLKFFEYVDYLAVNGFVPPNGKGWVDHIRKKGNEATHEIKLMSIDDAKELISFSEMLLKFIYEFPSRIPSTAA